MRQVTLDDNWDVPFVKVILGGSSKKNARGMLVFDTGSALTQLDIDLVETLGYSARDATDIRSVKGATGDAIEGYVVPISKLLMFGKEFKNVPVLTYDFKNFPGIDGLLGWDLIKQLHLEMIGPKQTLRVF